jgi:hypothetical protein
VRFHSEQSATKSRRLRGSCCLRYHSVLKMETGSSSEAVLAFLPGYMASRPEDNNVRVHIREDVKFHVKSITSKSTTGAHDSVVIKAQCYRPEDRGFETR